jgi:hypothetical protein
MRRFGRTALVTAGRQPDLGDDDILAEALGVALIRLHLVAGGLRQPVPLLAGFTERATAAIGFQFTQARDVVHALLDASNLLAAGYAGPEQWRWIDAIASGSRHQACLTAQFKTCPLLLTFVANCADFIHGAFSTRR